MPPAPSLDRARLEAALAPLPDARPLPRGAYTDAGVLALELDALFAGGWFAAASEADLARPGAWARVPLPGESLVVARGADLGLVALHDVCSHRGAQLLDGDAGALRALCVECPYHGWTYDLTGALTRAPGMPAGFDRAPRALRRARAEARYGVVFVALSAAAPDLDTYLAGGPPWLAPGRVVAPLARARSVRWEVRANWKLLVENFQEAHHFPRVHPGLEALTPFRASSSVTRDDAAWQGGVMDLRDDVETVSLTGRFDGRPRITPEGDASRRVHDALVCPNLLTSLQPDYLLTYRLHPVAVDRTLVVGETHVHPAALAPGLAHDALYAFWDRTNAEDRDVCERQQRGLASRAADPSCYAPSEDGVHAFDKWVARGLLRALASREAQG